jgi:Recombination endonuclease VII/HNH endonuclease
MKQEELTYDQMNAAIKYDPDNGLFFWKIIPGKGMEVGDPAGAWKRLNVKKTGEVKEYLYITYLGRNMVATRVAWLLTNGEWPSRTIQFVDGDTTNLRISNLKLAMFESKKVSKDGRKIHKMTKEAARHYGLKRHYGITLTEYAAMHNSQDGKCAICGNPETTMLHGKIRDLSVDHCHKSGKMRQLLCNACNHILGESKENKQTLLAAVAYLERHEADNLGTPVTQTGLADAAQTV